MRLAAEIAGSAVGLRIVDLLFDATWLAYSFVVIPLYANTIYWRAIRRRIDSVKRDVADAANQLWVLENRSHTSALWWIPVALVGLTIVGLLAARGIASMARGQVMEGLKLTAPLREAVAKYYATHHSWPGTLADLEMSPLRSRYVSDVSLDEGTITIHYAPEGVEEVANQSLSLRPILADHGRVRWVCATQMKPVEYVGVELEYLPPGCRPRAGAAAQSKGE
jgi:Pilin (bacterial filament)